MVMPKFYDDLVEGFSRKLQEAKGNVSSVKMTPEECAAEVKGIQDGAKSSFAHEEASAVLVKGLTQACGDESSVTFKDGTLTIAPKKRRGRPPGSRNKPKT